MLCFKWSLNLAYPISLGNKPKPKFVHFLINFIVCVQNVLSIIASKHKKKSASTATPVVASKRC